jgi:fibronectin-binding autotransporter adhesin
MAAPVIAASGAISTGTSSPTPAVPSGVVAGSLVVAVLWGVWYPATADADSSLLTAPAGWTVASFVATGEDGGSNGRLCVFFAYHYATSSESGTYTGFSFQSGAGGTRPVFNNGGAYAMRITGGPTSGNPFVDTFQTQRVTGASTTKTQSTFTPTASNSLLLGVLYGDVNTTSTWPSGWTRDAHDQSNGLFDFGHLAQTTAAATGTLTWTFGVSSDGRIAGVATIRTPSGATAALGGSGSMTAARALIITRTSSLAGAGLLSVTALPLVGEPVTLGGTGSLGATGAPSEGVSAGMGGSGTLAAAGSPSLTTPTVLSGAGGLSVVAQPSVVVVAALSGAGALTVLWTAEVGVTAALAGAGALSVSASLSIEAAAALSGSGVLTAAGSSSGGHLADLSGAGTITVHGSPFAGIEVALSGSGSLGGIGAAILPALVALAGIGVLTAITSGPPPAGSSPMISGQVRLPRWSGYVEQVNAGRVRSARWKGQV